LLSNEGIVKILFIVHIKYMMTNLFLRMCHNLLKDRLMNCYIQQIKAMLVLANVRRQLQKEFKE